MSYTPTQIAEGMTGRAVREILNANCTGAVEAAAAEAEAAVATVQTQVESLQSQVTEEPFRSDEIEESDAALLTKVNSCIKALYFNTTLESGHRYALTYLYHWGNKAQFRVTIVDYDESAGTQATVLSQFQFTGDTLADLEDVNGNVIGKIYASVSGYSDAVQQADRTTIRMPYCNEMCWRLGQDAILEENFTNLSAASTSLQQDVDELTEKVSPTLLGSDNTETSDTTKCAAANAEVKALYLSVQPESGHRFVLSYLYLQTSDNSWYMSIIDLDQKADPAISSTLVSSCKLTDKAVSTIKDVNGNSIGLIYVDSDNYTLIGNSGEGYARMPYLLPSCFDKLSQDILLRNQVSSNTTTANNAKSRVAVVEEELFPSLLGSDNTETSDTTKCAAANAEVKALYLSVQPESGHRFVLSYLYLQTSDNSWYMSIRDLNISAGTTTQLVSSCKLTDKAMSVIKDVNGNKIGFIYVDSDNYTLIDNAGEGYARMPYLLSSCFDATVQTDIYRSLTDSRLNALELKVSKKYITIWGNSITWGSAASANNLCYVSRLRTMLSEAGYNHEVINCGVGGDNMPTILGRMGGTMLYINKDITIPASASSSVVVDTVANYVQVGRYLKAACKPNVQIQLMMQGDLGRTHIGDDDKDDKRTVNPVLINGVECVWSWEATTEGQADAGTYKLAVKETQSADVVVKAGTPIYPHGARLKSDVAVFAMGTNGGFSSADDYINMTDLAIEAVNTKHYIVCSPYGGTALSTFGVDGLEAIEEALQARYGAKFFNWRKYLVEEGLTVEGLTATSEDETAIAAGEVPPSLLADVVHPNDYGHDAIAKRLYQMMEALGYFD